MIKLTDAQKLDLETIMYFIPEVCKNIPINEEDVKMFFEYSEKGLHKDKIKNSHFIDGFNALVQGKRWRGIHMEMWEQGVIDKNGNVPYSELLKETPRSVVDFMKKEMFRGNDSETIEKCYQALNS